MDQERSDPGSARGARRKSIRTAHPTRRRRAAAAIVLSLAAATVAACQDGDDGSDGGEQESAVDQQESAAAPDARASATEPERAENVIVIVGDGLGIAHRELIRLTTVGQDGELAMNQLQYQGWTQTDPADPERAVTDSAAAATALATGVRTVNGAIAVDPDGNPVTALLERAGQAGKATGLVTTARVTDATPAAFAAHAAERDEQSEIARQYLEETNVDVILGGGEDRWYPAGNEGELPAGQDEESKGEAGNLVDRALELGYQHVSNADELATADGFPLLGLFANEEMFEYDEGEEARYDPAVPLPDMAAAALEVLSQDEEGFFLVVEEEGVDAMAHRNDARLLLEAGRALDETVAVARGFADEHGSTLVVVVGDHDTGGLAIEYVEGEPPEEDENGPFTVAGTDLLVSASWATGGHTAVATPASADGPGAQGMVDVRNNTDIHDLVLEAMQLDR